MNITVRDLMTRSPVIVNEKSTLREALTRLLDESAPEIYVADSSGRFLGSVPDYELLKVQMNGSADVRDVNAVMSRSVTHVEPEMPISEVAGRFRDGRHRRLPVVEEGRIVG
ncbi:MAG: CBS domain-containing protein, partial [Planctomycetes bacterium]|nr:CBS domain-containing protein [Planctomycetota bacterium]